MRFQVAVLVFCATALFAQQAAPPPPAREFPNPQANRPIRVGGSVAQQAPVPEGYVDRTNEKMGRPSGSGAPKIKVIEFSKTGRRFEVVMSKGDEIISGLTEFAEK